MKANQQLLHDSARAVATLAHSQPIPGIYELLQNAQRTFIKMAESMQQDIDKLHKQIQKLNEFDRQTKNLFATSLEEMQLAMQGILVLNETTVKSNGLYTLPSGVDKSYFTEIKKEASTVLETAKSKIELIKKTDSLEEISRKTIACANIGINPYTGEKITESQANRFKYAAWSGTLTEIGNVVLGSYYGNKAASRLDGIDDVGNVKKGRSSANDALTSNKNGNNYVLDRNKSTGTVTYKKVNGSTNTVWDDIKGTQPPREGTTIPKSFEMSVNGEKLWVNPNGTKHMVEYSTRNLSHGQKLTEQQLLRSFQGAVEQATSTGIKFNAKIIIDNWELIFSPAREAGQLPVIKHAVYLP